MKNEFSRIGIVCAMQMEADGYVAEMQNAKVSVVSGVTFTEGKLWGKDAVVAVSGIGKVFAAIAAEAMILRFGIDALLNTGVAGGLEPSLRVCDAVVATGVVQHDMNTTAIGDPRGLLSGINLIEIPADARLSDALAAAAESCGVHTVRGVIASGDLFVAKEKTKEGLRRDFSAAACEMEGAAVGHVAYVNRIPFAVLRTISDGGDGMEFSKFAPLAAAQSVRVAKAFFGE